MESKAGRVTKPGALTLYAGIRSTLSEGMHPYDSIPWRKKTTLKLVPYDNLANYPWGAAAGVPQVTLEKYLELDRYSTKDARMMLNEAQIEMVSILDWVGVDWLIG
eukprot:Skav235059  [mRNA]  locus=scaffold3697:302085:308188:- [translate_table: standard]